ncbi:PREDICTED: protein Daple [Myotis brandtii]|uniref:protein Daple n=1 Tax=Myotis brandtii TaxID=109478 RepID=UPI0003BB8746|nr:PREDICTED: protein Daple [Myotis brandtii]
MTSMKREARAKSVTTCSPSLPICMTSTWQSLLIFDILEKLGISQREKDMELILLMLRNVGFLLRKDDVLSLEVITETQAKAIGAGGKFQDKTRIRFMLEMMLVLKSNKMQRILGYDPEPVEKLRKLQRALDRGHIPQQLLKELLGDSMALEAEQVQRMNQPAHLSWEMEQQSEASSHILELKRENKGTVQELQGASIALQESSIKYKELKEENQQLQKQMEELQLQLLQEKDNSQEWESLTEELVKELEQLLHEVDTLKADRALQMLELERQLQKEKDNSQNLENINKELLNDLKQVLDAVDTVKAEAPQLDPSILASKNQQAAKEREWEELYELLEQLIEVHEALLQDHACLGALHDQLSGQYQALTEEHSRHKTLLRGSLEMESKAFRRREQDQRQHEESLQELRKLLNTQREALKQEQEANTLAAQEKERLRQELDRANFWSQLVKGEQNELRIQSKGMQMSLEKLQQEVRLWQARYEGAKEDLQSMEISVKKLSSQCEVLSSVKENLEEEKDNLKSQIDTLANRNSRLLNENEDNAQRIEEGNLLTVKEEEETIMDTAPRKKKRWIGARTFIKFFKCKNNGSGEPAEPTPDSPPGPLEATPSCSYRMEERDAPSVPVGKAARHKKNKRKQTDKSPAARPALLKRLRCWSSSDIPPPSK